MQPFSFFSPFGSVVEVLCVLEGEVDMEGCWAAGACVSGVEVWLLGLAVEGGVLVPCGSVAGVVCAMAVATKNTNAVTIVNDSFFIFFFSPESKYVKNSEP